MARYGIFHKIMWYSQTPWNWSYLNWTYRSTISLTHLVLHKPDVLRLTNNVCDHSTCEPCFSVLTVTTRRSAITDCTVHRVWNVKHASFLLGVIAFRPNFYGNGVISCQNIDNTLDPRYNALQYNADSVITRLRSWTPTFQGLAKAA